MTILKNTLLFLLAVFVITQLPYNPPESYWVHMWALTLVYIPASYLLMRASIFLESEFGI